MKVRVIGLLALLLFLPGCFGSFPMASRMWDGNNDISDRYMVNQTAFLIMLPAYIGGVIMDLVMFNILEATHDGDVIDEGGKRGASHIVPPGGPEKTGWNPEGQGTAGRGHEGDQ